jgi:hypothetical protein
LRDATEAVRDVQRGSRALTGFAGDTGHDELDLAIGEFLGSWEQSLGAVAQHGETLSRMLHLASASSVVEHSTTSTEGPS